MRIIIDENMPVADALFTGLGEIVRLPGRLMTAEQVAEADVLLVRSVTKVNSALLAHNQQLKFVGTATIGTDHIDQALLAERGIAFSSAPGCNKVGVAEYVISSLLVLAERYQLHLAGMTLGMRVMGFVLFPVAGLGMTITILGGHMIGGGQGQAGYALGLRYGLRVALALAVAGGLLCRELICRKTSQQPPPSCPRTKCRLKQPSEANPQPPSTSYAPRVV